MAKSCDECPQCIVKEIEPELPAFCLYWKEGLMLESPACRNYNEGRIPEEPVSPLSDLPTAALHGGQAGSEDFQFAASLLPDQSSSSQSNDVCPGRHLVEITSVRGYMHNFQDYAGPRARLKMKVLEGPDAGKFLFDNVSLLHPKESKGMCQRRLRIAYRLGLISRGTDLTIPINWKLLEGVVCRVDVDYKSFGGRIVPMVDNYELIEYDAHTPSMHPLPLASAAANPVIEEHHDTTPPFPLETCKSCPWYTLNPWTRDPALGAWCHYRMEHLVVGSLACEEFRRGEVPPRQPNKQVSAVPSTTAPDSPETPETPFVCSDCPHFHPNNGRNPRQGWGRCLKRNRGKFGCATACEAALTDDGAGP